MIGRKFGRLRVWSFADKDPKGRDYWYVTCRCGRNKRVCGSSLRNGLTKSCGCYRRESSRRLGKRSFKHGYAQRNRTYRIWTGMRNRCHNKRNKDYLSYGGRGIRVTKRWDVFENFLSDMGEAPEGLTLDRANNDGNYTKSNCRWATRRQQAHNRRAPRAK